jgi:hypothetical protein
MTHRTKFAVSLIASVATAGPALAAAPVAEGGRKFTVQMSGQQEVNTANPTGGAGDPDGTGTALVYVNVGQQRVCWNITVNNIAAPTRGHIHRAPRLTNGPILVTFFESGNVDLENCTTTPLDRELLKDIIQNPQDYYVNVHNTPFGGGAVRGQMSK